MKMKCSPSQFNEDTGDKNKHGDKNRRKDNPDIPKIWSQFSKEKTWEGEHVHFLKHENIEKEHVEKCRKRKKDLFSPFTNELFLLNETVVLLNILLTKIATCMHRIRCKKM